MTIGQRTLVWGSLFRETKAIVSDISKKKKKKCFRLPQEWVTLAEQYDGNGDRKLDGEELLGVAEHLLAKHVRSLFHE